MSAKGYYWANYITGEEDAIYPTLSEILAKPEVRRVRTTTWRQGTRSFYLIALTKDSSEELLFGAVRKGWDLGANWHAAPSGRDTTVEEVIPESRDATTWDSDAQDALNTIRNYQKPFAVIVGIVAVGVVAGLIIKAVRK